MIYRLIVERLRATGIALTALVFLTPFSMASAEETVDLELVLAVDSSSSVSDQEFDLQMKGIAAAFQSEAVVGAIQAAGDRGIAVTLIQWSDNVSQSTAVDWMKVSDMASAEAFSREIEAAPRYLVGGSTAIGGALKFATRQLERNAYEGVRKVIDLSGDGRTNQGPGPDTYRDLAVVQGVTINGLAILNEDLYVDRYYRRSVIGGTGAFVMTASDYVDFADAILLKLIKEIAGVPVAQAPGRGTAEHPPVIGQGPSIPEGDGS